jgi:hypothetical protein
MTMFRAAGHIDVDVTPENWRRKCDFFLLGKAVHRWADRATAQYVLDGRAKKPHPTRIDMSELMAITVGIGKQSVVFRMMLTDTATGADIIAFQEWARAGLEAEIESISDDVLSEYAKASAAK